jgi:hypothetical protein
MEPHLCGMTGQFRQSVFGRLGGYDDVNDANRLGCDPAMCWILGCKAIEGPAASTSQMGRFETELLASDENLAALADLSGKSCGIDQSAALNNPLDRPRSARLRPCLGTK